MNIPEGLKYAKSHEWVQFLDDTTALDGITDFAQDALGDLVFINLPEVGDMVVSGDVFTDVESVKAVSDVYCPVTGNVDEINEALLDNPALINEDPYGAWFIKVSGITDTEELLDADAYQAVCEAEEG